MRVVQCNMKPLVNEKYNCSEFKPPYDSRGCIKAVSVSYCASDNPGVEFMATWLKRWL